MLAGSVPLGSSKTFRLPGLSWTPPISDADRWGHFWRHTLRLHRITPLCAYPTGRNERPPGRARARLSDLKRSAMLARNQEPGAIRLDQSKPFTLLLVSAHAATASRAACHVVDRSSDRHHDALLRYGNGSAAPGATEPAASRRATGHLGTTAAHAASTAVRRTA